MRHGAIVIMLAVAAGLVLGSLAADGRLSPWPGAALANDDDGESDNSGSGSDSSGSDSSGSGSSGSDSSASDSADSDSSDSDSSGSSSDDGAEAGEDAAQEESATEAEIDGGHRGRGRNRHAPDNFLFHRLFGQERSDRDGSDRLSDDVLAVDLSQGDIAIAEASGFRVRDAQQLLGLDLGIIRLSPPAGMSANEGAAALRRILPSRPVDLDHAYTLQDHGCGSGDCWQATLIGWTPASASCVRNLRLGMVDTGVDDHLQALAGARISSRRFLDATSGMRRSKDIAHGTAVAALLVGQDGSGLLPGSELLVADVFGKTDGGPRTGAIEIARGLDWLAGEGVTVVNLSLAGPANAALAAAVEHARKQGMSIVAAAGNAGPLAPPAYPAAYPGVVAATAVGRDFTLYSMANHGDYVAFAAPGVDLETADPAKGHLRRSGTSFAAAFVTAAVALARGQAPEKTADEIEALLAAEALDLGDPGRDSAYGWGLLRTEPGCAGG